MSSDQLGKPTFKVLMFLLEKRTASSTTNAKQVRRLQALPHSSYEEPSMPAFLIPA